MVLSSLKKEMSYSHRVLDVHKRTDVSVKTNKTTKKLAALSGLLPENLFVVVFIWFGGGLTLGR